MYVLTVGAAHPLPKFFVFLLILHKHCFIMNIFVVYLLHSSSPSLFLALYHPKAGNLTAKRKSVFTIQTAMLATMELESVCVEKSFTHQLLHG